MDPRPFRTVPGYADAIEFRPMMGFTYANGATGCQVMPDVSSFSCHEVLPGASMAWSVTSGREAWKKISEVIPDLITVGGSMCSC